MIPFVDLKAQYISLKSEINGAINAVIADTAFIGGHFVAEFEAAFADYLGIAHCMSCANGTDALEIMLKSMNIGPGDEVIVPANTWISTSEAVTTVGAKPVFIDNDPVFYTMDTTQIEAAITPNTKAIIPVHLYGLPADMDPIMALAKQYSLFVLEDCAQAHGAQYKGQMVGTIGHAATFSFFPGKNLGAYGDAGAMVTQDAELAKTARMIANHGRLGKFDHSLEGRNSRLDGIQAAILSVKLPYLEQWTTLRRAHAQTYTQLLSPFDILLPTAPETSRHVYHLYVVQVPNRDQVRHTLEQQGIQTGIHYPIPLPLTQAYQYRELPRENFPVSSTQMHRILSLPLYAELTEQLVEQVTQALQAAIESQKVSN